MKKRLFALGLAGVLAAMTGCVSKMPEGQPEEPVVTDGNQAVSESKTYTSVVRGFYGDYEVYVTLDGNKITDIAVGEGMAETPGVGDKAVSIMSADMIARNTGNVDTVAGATASSAPFRAAVMSALREAGAPAEMLAAAEYTKGEEQTVSTDVLVIGGGGGGLSAAITAAQNGAKVTLIEKQGFLGGNTLISAGIVYGALSQEDVPGMVEYYMTRAEGNADEELLTFYAENSLDTIAFIESTGMAFTFAGPSGTAPEARARFSPGFTGAALINSFTAKAEELGVTILTNVEGVSLVQNENGVVTGAKATGKDCDYTFEAGAVVLATGGFDMSTEMKELYAPDSANDRGLSNAGSTGDGIRMGIEAGAATVFKGGMIGFTTINPYLSNSGQSGISMGAPVYVKKDGSYLINNIDYPITHTAVKESGDDFVYGLYAGEDSRNGESAIDFGRGFKGDTIEELAAAIEADAEKLAESFSQAGLEEGPFYAVVVMPTTIGSMGGLKINTNAEVVSEDGSPIPGLYATGEVANGDFYYKEYPASGTSNSITITFGRIAGEKAAAFVAE